MNQVVDIPWWQLTLFLSVLAVPLYINHKFKLGLGKEGGLAVGRMLLQLTLVGVYLNSLFALDSLWLNLGWILLMVVVGAHSVTGKSQMPLKRVMLPVATGLALVVVPLLALMLMALIRPEPILGARYMIPLAGMLLGNSLGANVIALQRLGASFKERAGEYEGALALGARPTTAAADFVRESLAAAQGPILATTATTGLVTLPGMMTGQILGGADPIVAIKYQMVIMVAVLVMTSVSAAVTLSLALPRLVTATGRVNLCS
ncbi:ABC transporter permease [Ferrimonas sp. YFM]|uniref:ABC transporter permease n=1 Tax=Ferrimonas sp. YFM TaxID=3028878 RepID=UPI002572FC47|nr:ABC transporter permease [Ferrimonas sp. YFM]BDY04877.1 ABC transporter permease [Ferrimonas sp. YFM]